MKGRRAAGWLLSPSDLCIGSVLLSVVVGGLGFGGGPALLAVASMHSHVQGGVGKARQGRARVHVYRVELSACSCQLCFVC